MSGWSPSTDHNDVLRELDCQTADEQMIPKTLEDSDKRDYSEEIKKYRKDEPANAHIEKRHFYTEPQGATRY